MPPIPADGEADVLVAAAVGEPCPAPPEMVGGAVVVSDRLTREDVFTTERVVRCVQSLRAQRHRGQRLTRDVRGIPADALGHLDSRGVVRVGTEVSRGDILVGTVDTPPADVELARLLTTGPGSSPEDRSLRYEFADPGRVVGVELRSLWRCHCGRCGDVGGEPETATCPHCGDRVDGPRRDDLRENVTLEVTVDVLVRRELRVGDVLDDGQGNRVVVAGVLAAGRMPAVDGGVVDVWTHASSPLAARLRQRGTLVGGAARAGQTCAWDHVRLRKVTARLEDKWQARGQGPYSFITALPLGAGELVDPGLAAALLRAGYRANLAEMLTLRSDAALWRERAHEAIRDGKAVELAGVPFTTLRLDRCLKALCLPALVQADDGREQELARGVPGRGPARLRVGLADPHEIRNWSFGEVKKPETINYRTYRPEPGGLFCERIFGPEKDWECACGKYRGLKHEMICDRCGVKVTHSRVRRERMGHIELAAPVVHFWALLSPLGLGAVLGMSRARLREVIDNQRHVVIEPGPTPLRRKQLLTDEGLQQARQRHGDAFEAGTGATAIRELLERLDPMRESAAVVARTAAEQAGPRPRARVLRALARRLAALAAADAARDLPRQLVLDCIAVLPADLRPLVLLDNGNFATSDLNDLYRRLINRNNRVKKLVELAAPEPIVRNEKRMLQQAVDAVFDNGQCERPVLGQANRPLRSLADHVEALLRDLARKRTDYSGRGVVVPGPSLRRGTIGLPRPMARELFQTLTTSEVPDDRGVLVIAGGRAAGLRPAAVDGEALRLHPEDARRLGVGFTSEQVSVHVALSAAAVRELSQPGPATDASSELVGLRPGRLMRLALTGEARALTPFDAVMTGSEVL
jgi:hypothetical protein